MAIETCNHIFGRIADGRVSEPKTFDAIATHGVFTLIANKQATVGHSLVLPTECEPITDLLTAETRRNMSIVSRATGIWLHAAFRANKVTTVIDGDEVPHAHEHRTPKYRPRDYLKVMGAEDPKPFAKMSDDQHAEVLARATLAPEYAELVHRELNGIEEVLPETLVAMAHDLAEPITASSMLIPLLQGAS